MRRITDIKSVIFTVEDIWSNWNENHPRVSCYYDIRVERHRSPFIGVLLKSEKINYDWNLVILVTVKDLNFFTGFWYKRKFQKLLRCLRDRAVDRGFVVNETYGLLFFNKKLVNNGLRSFQAILTIGLRNEPKLPELHRSSENKKVVREYSRLDFLDMH